MTPARVYYNDNDPDACEWLRQLIAAGEIPAGDVDDRSILDVTADELSAYDQCHFFAGIGGWALALRLAGMEGVSGIWTGSPPCQPFSPAGKQLGKDDERHLAPHFAHLVATGRPDRLYGEQVASAEVFGRSSSRAQRNRANNTADDNWCWFDDLSARLEGAHYAVAALDLPASSVGAPHIRSRCFFGAIRLGDGMCEGLEGHGRHVNGGREPGRINQNALGQTGKPGAALRTMPRHIGWERADWLACRDGTFRPVESGTFPLAHGLPARMGRLRGYGNAIVPQVAATFVTAFNRAVAQWSNT